MPAVGQTRAYLALTLVVALWGSYPAFAKLALQHFPPFFTNLQPMVGVLLASVMLGELIVAAELVGGAAVLAGVALTTRQASAGDGEPSPGRSDTLRL